MGRPVENSESTAGCLARRGPHRTPVLLDARTRAEYEARVRAAEAAVDQSKANQRRAAEALELADHDYERAVEVFKQRAISQREFD